MNCERQPAILKQAKRHIIYTWIILICFMAGQGMIYAHQHIIKYAVLHTQKSDQNRTTVTEKCQLCDAMHHTSMVINTNQYITPVVSANHFYKQGTYDFISISLVLASGRAPPVS